MKEKPDCKDCRKLHKLYKTQTPCTDCMPELWPENEALFRVLNYAQGDMHVKNIISIMEILNIDPADHMHGIEIILKTIRELRQE